MRTFKGYGLAYSTNFIRVGNLNFKEYSSHTYAVCKTNAGLVAFDPYDNKVFGAASTIEKLEQKLRKEMDYKATWVATFYPL